MIEYVIYFLGAIICILSYIILKKIRECNALFEVYTKALRTNNNSILQILKIWAKTNGIEEIEVFNEESDPEEAARYFKKNYDNLTWRCDVCGRERHDKFISVYKKPLKGFKEGVAEQNIKYCNDREHCHEMAELYDLFELSNMRKKSIKND